MDKGKMGCGGGRRGGSNTAITTQLISTGVTERISVTPSMFTQPGGGNPPLRRRKRDGGERVIPPLGPFNQAVIMCI